MSQIPSSFDLSQRELGELTFWERIKYHCRQQPFVPIGALLTTGAVVMAAQNIRKGNSRNAQYYFRWRVGLQGATLIALVAGSFIYGSSKLEQKAKEDKLRQKAKLREQLWIKELEKRDEAMKERKKRAEDARLKTQQNEESIKKLEKELNELEEKLDVRKDETTKK